MALNAGMYRGRVGDRAFFNGLGNVGSVYAGSGPYRAPTTPPGMQVAGVRGLRLGATRLAQFRNFRNSSLPVGVAGVGDRPVGALRRVQLPDGRIILSR